MTDNSAVLQLLEAHTIEDSLNHEQSDRTGGRAGRGRSNIDLDRKAPHPARLRMVLLLSLASWALLLIIVVSLLD